MMKKILALAALACVSAFASLQFQIVGNNPNGQSWYAAQEISLQITQGGSLWIAHKIDAESQKEGLLGYSMDANGAFHVPDLDFAQNPDYNPLNMAAGNYGYGIGDAQGNVSSWVASNGDTKELTFIGSEGNEIKSTGYFVGNFEAGQSVFIWVTAAGGDVEMKGYSDGPVNGSKFDGLDDNGWQVWSNVDVPLAGRQDNTIDLVGNTVVNFNYTDGKGYEFIFAGEETYYDADLGATPLPGVLASLFVFGSIMGGAKTLKRRKK